MNTMIRFYSQAKDAQQKQAMAFELSSFDQKLLKFGQLFRERFMNIEVSLRLEQALDLCWQTLAECFEPQELLMKQALVDKYYPQSKPTGNSRPSLSPDRATASPQTGDEDKNESSVSATANRQPSALNLNHG